MIDEKVLRNEEKTVFELRSLYGKYGYVPLRMSKFEEYELYSHNKDFLDSDQIITFNDINGKLMALKPDVTLSIVKNGKDREGYKQKVYYNENIYRTAGGSRQFREIMQAGLECIGDIDRYDIIEVISLAAQTLRLISEEFVLEISHLGILSSLLDESGGDETFRKKAMAYIAEKNVHDLRRVCVEYDIPEKQMEKLCSFIGIYGDLDTVTDKLEPLCESEESRDALEELRLICSLVKKFDYSDRINCDFSIVNNMNYYNGIVFRGFLNGICEGVLSGGQYDNLLRKMGRRSGDVGFALYLDLLDDLMPPAPEHMADVLVLYDEGTDLGSMTEKIRTMIVLGKTVSVQKCIPEKFRYREVLDLRKDGNYD